VRLAVPLVVLVGCGATQSSNQSSATQSSANQSSANQASAEAPDAADTEPEAGVVGA